MTSAPTEPGNLLWSSTPQIDGLQVPRPSAVAEGRSGGLMGGAAGSRGVAGGSVEMLRAYCCPGNIEAGVRACLLA